MDIRTGQSYIVIPRLPKALETRIVDINGFWVTFETLSIHINFSLIYAVKGEGLRKLI